MDLLRAITRIVPTEDGIRPLRRHSAVVSAINPAGLATIELMGAPVPSVPVLAGADVAPGDVVETLVWRDGILVIGRVAESAGDIPGGGGRTGADEWYIPATSGQNSAGDAELGVIGAFTTSATPVLRFPPSAVSRTTFLCRPPQHWSTFTLTVLWSATNGVISPVSWSTRQNTLDIGEAVKLGSESTVVDSTTGNNRLVGTVMGSGLTIGDGLFRVMVTRNGTSAADTYAADAALWGILLQQDS